MSTVKTTFSAFPRAARRKLSTAGITNPPPTPFFLFEPSLGAGSQPPPTSPRLLSSHPGTLALTVYSPKPSNNSSSSRGGPRYTSSDAYPHVPPIFFIPSPLPQPVIYHSSPSSKHAAHADNATYSLDMGAYGIPKRRREDDSGDSSSASSSSSGPSKEDPAAYSLAVQVGEDAYFLRTDALGVADGVGGWRHKAKSGEANSALLARKLMHYCSLELEHEARAAASAHSSSSSSSSPNSTQASSTHSPDPIAILQHSYERCINEAQQTGLLGSTTALLAILADSELRIAHLGDCALCLVRNGEMVYRSEEMQHSFNYPFQLGPKSTSTPATDAQRITIPVQPGDILILASDGMGDNLWDEDILDEVRRFVGPGTSNSPGSNIASSPPSTSTRTGGTVTNVVLAQRLSEALASRAKRVSEGSANQDPASIGVFAPKSAKDKTSKPALTRKQPAPTSRGTAYGEDGVGVNVQESIQEEVEEDPWMASHDEIPFGRKAKEAGLRFVGGKNDDISVLVAIISGNSATATAPAQLRMNLSDR
ncbi:hypothetical protein FRC03_009640 [Tulasnella sp. 419]|nr:hypothetical protein FRC02_006685 [Tulasnella sp. 418]KAG8970367.1 hypothetical protein FRC03_009640 [Tulasnella sp. 419]